MPVSAPINNAPAPKKAAYVEARVLTEEFAKARQVLTIKIQTKFLFQIEVLTGFAAVVSMDISLIMECSCTAADILPFTSLFPAASSATGEAEA